MEVWTNISGILLETGCENVDLVPCDGGCLWVLSLLHISTEKLLIGPKHAGASKSVFGGQAKLKCACLICHDWKYGVQSTFCRIHC